MQKSIDNQYQIDIIELIEKNEKMNEKAVE